MIKLLQKFEKTLKNKLNLNNTQQTKHQQQVTNPTNEHKHE